MRDECNLSSWPTRQIVFSPDGAWLVTSSSDIVGYSYMWDVAQALDTGFGSRYEDGDCELGGLLINDLPGYTGRATFNPDANLLAVAGYDGLITIFGVAALLGVERYSDGMLNNQSESTQTMNVATLDKHTALVNDLVFASDGRLLISSGGDGTVRFWGIPD